MKPVIFAILAVFCYVILNVVIERKLSHASPLANNVFLFGMGLVFLVPAMLIQRQFDEKFTWPPLNNIWLILGIGVVIAFADYLYLKAYHSGGSLIMISTMVALFPFFASLLSAATGGALPGKQQLLGWGFAVVAIILLSQKPPDTNQESKQTNVIATEDHSKQTL